MSTCFIVETCFGLILYGFRNLIIVRLIVRNVNIATCLLSCCSNLRLQYIREHLNVITTCTIAFRPSCINVATIVEAISKTYLGQQFLEMVTLVMGKRRCNCRLNLHTHYIFVHKQAGRCLVVDCHVRVVVAQAKRCTQAAGNVDIAFVVETHIESWRAEKP